MNTQEQTIDKMPEYQRPYTPPKIIYETELETKAGSPLGYEDPLSIIEP